MRHVSISDDPSKVWLTPERVASAMGVLHWDAAHLSAVSGVPLATIVGYVDFGVALAVDEDGAIKRVLLEKVEFTTSEGEPGIVRKAHVTGPLSHVTFGDNGRRRKRPKL